jgi:hypothetical protein
MNGFNLCWTLLVPCSSITILLDTVIELAEKCPAVFLRFAAHRRRVATKLRFPWIASHVAIPSPL